MNKILTFLNPISHLGKRQYSIVFPLITTITTAVILEIYANLIGNLHFVDNFALLLFIGYIIYFSFRNGLKGGYVTAFVTIVYYFYIIYFHAYRSEQQTASLQITAILSVLYFLLATTIGWLKETIDKLIDKEADARRWLEAIIEQLPVGVVVIDDHGKVAYENKYFENLLGTRIPKDYIFGKDLLLKSYYKGKELPPSESPLGKALAYGKKTLGKEYQVARRDGKTIHLEVNASPIHNKHGKIMAAAQILHDITQQKQLEERKDDFINMASHELKTPITSMKLYIDSLIPKVVSLKDERILKTLTSIKYQTEKLQDLVSDLLDVSRIQTGKLSFTYEPFVLNELVVEIVDGIQATTKHPLTLLQKQQVTVVGDRFRLYQVITNLLTNAIKYSPSEKNIAITIQKNKDAAVVSIKDEGIGISKDQQKKIFEKLYQVTDDKEKTFPGLGMGLYISQEIIKRHKGSIWVESEKGKGSTFFFSIPLK